MCSICLLVGSNSLLTGVLRLCTHVYILFTRFFGLTSFLQVHLIGMCIHMFLGLCAYAYILLSACVVFLAGTLDWNVYTHVPWLVGIRAHSIVCLLGFLL